MWRRQFFLLICQRSGYQSSLAGTQSCYREQSTGIESSRQMQKLLTKKGANTKRKWYQPHVAEPLELSGRRQRPTKQGVSESQGHRARQLSHVLYAKICQLANSGELSEDLLNRQVLFTQVKLHPTFTGLNVYWDANRSDAADIEILLNTLSGKLRSLLISYHVLGRIPKITFVKDKATGDLTRLNELFEIADYGPDYLPSSPDSSGNILSLPVIDTSNTQLEARDINFIERLSALSFEDPEVNTDKRSKSVKEDNVAKFSSEAGWQAENPSLTNNDEKTTAVDDPFNFRSNLYGLPRDELMRKVVAQKKKLRFQSTGNDSDCFTPVSLPRDYSKLKSKSRERERMLQQRDSTKVKQQLLEREFDEIQESLTVHEEFEAPPDNDEEYEDYEPDDWDRK